MAAAPIGRPVLWSNLLARLDQPGGSVLVVAGEPGSGRSHVLRRFGAEAAEHGYRTVGCVDSYGVEKTTKFADLVRMLASMLAELGLPEPDRAVVHERSRWQSLLRSANAAAQFERQVFSMLRDAAPIVAAIDGYAPSPVVDLWFATRLIPRITAAELPVVLVITGQRAPLQRISGAASETFELGPLDEAEVIEHLSTVGAGVRPSLTEAELAGYYQKIAGDPRVLRGLSTVLSAVAEGW
jgi:hypothetical protein